jgi:repressor LexA
MKPAYTPKQGQYLAFIDYYSKLNGRPPSEADMQWHFKRTPPSVHQMVLTLEQRGFIERTPRQPRTIRVLLPREALPNLE